MSHSSRICLKSHGAVVGHSCKPAISILSGRLYDYCIQTLYLVVSEAMNTRDCKGVSNLQQGA